MRSILVGNGINIHFGGVAYTSDFIMKRIKYKTTLGNYERLFGNTLSPTELLGILNGFVTIANEIRNNEYDKYVKDEDTLLALNDFKRRYNTKINFSYEIMLEDWFFVLHLFFLKNLDLSDNTESAKQGFERLILDAIYNEGKIQDVNLEIPKKVKRFFIEFDNIFTLNYDKNLESLTNKKVYHLHGDFCVLENSENPDNVLGYIRKNEGNTVCFEDMKHCFCNAMLNYSGQLKYKLAKNNHMLISESTMFKWRFENDSSFLSQLNKVKIEKPFEYKMVMTKIENPTLNMATEYYFDKFENIQDELHILGMSPNNDAHIFNSILGNKNISRIVFYYHSDKARQFIENKYPNDLFKCVKVTDLWESLNAIPQKYNCNYHIPKEVEQFIDIFNGLSNDKVTKDQIINCVNSIPQFEAVRLCKLIKTELNRRNPKHSSLSEDEFIREHSAISYIALQEGVLPSALYMICIMNFEYLKE